QYPNSPLRAAVRFRHAENAYFAALAAEKQPNPNREAVNKALDEAAKRYQAVIDQHPEFERASLARYGVALARLRQGDYEKAQAALEAIPGPDRNGELALTPYLLADCLIRQAPARADDALAAGKLQEQLQNAAQLLDGYINASPKEPET